jgi:hypothetical protein
MGAIVTKPEDGSEQSQRHHFVDESSKKMIEKEIPMKLSDMPLGTYAEVLELLPICVTSWNHVVHTKVNGTLLGDLFQINVFDGLRNLKHDSGKIIEMLLSDSRKKRSMNPVTFVMRYCIKTKRSSEAAYKKKLLMLGREHSRIGVDGDMITQFCEILLNAFGSVLCDPMTRTPIMYAWMANMRFIVWHMTNVRFSFMRVLSDDSCDNMENSVHGLSSEDSCESLMSTEVGTDVGELRHTLSFGYDGLDHSCHAIPEGSSKEVSVLFQTPTELFSWADQAIQK